MKIGIYGGSFNPPHLGHINAAVSAAWALSLDQILLVPTGIPPHKKLAEDTPDVPHRLFMASLVAQQLAIEAKIPVFVTNIELVQEEASYTSDTLSILRERFRDDELWLLMGSDMFNTFQDWKAPEKILDMAGICAFGRMENDGEEAFAAQRAYLTEKYPHARICILTLPKLIEASSTAIRAALRHGDRNPCLPPAVYGYILREHLYGSSADLHALSTDMLRPVALSYLNAGRIPHVLGTEQEAVKLAERYGADVEKARRAALLHDCTKKLSQKRQEALCERFLIELDEVERANVKLLHARTGAALVHEIFRECDEVCDAIRWHTTGRANMTLLEKIIYIADYIEPTRDFDGVEQLRKLAYENLDAALLQGLSMTVEDMTRANQTVHKNTILARDFLRGLP